MKDLFNRTFVRFTIGFVCILLASFAASIVASHFEDGEVTTAAAGGR
jgi:hypothetical protein